MSSFDNNKKVEDEEPDCPECRAEHRARHSHSHDNKAKQSDSDSDEQPDSPIMDHVRCTKHKKDFFHWRDGSWGYCANRPNWLNGMLATVVVGLGAIEGYAFTAGGIGRDPDVIIKQMSGFKNNRVLLLFMSAVGASCVFQSAISLLMPSFFNETRVTRYGKAGWLKTVVGAGMIGVGMAASGGGPTMTPAQAAAGVPSASATLLGFLVGGAVFYAVDRAFLHKTHIHVDERKERIVLDEKLKVPYWKIALPMGFGLLAAAYYVENFVLDANKERAMFEGTIGPITLSPIIVGSVIGFGQIGSRFIGHAGQGGSSAVMTVASTLTGGLISPGMFPSGNWEAVWQPLFVWGGTTLGSAYACWRNPDFAPAAGPPMLRAFLGGVVAQFGAKLASGCACGRGVTGSSELAPEGFLAGAVMFGVGIATALAMGW